MSMTMTGPRLWVPPRFGTPRNPDRATYGGQVADVMRRLGKEPMPHQCHVWDVGLELEPDPETGELRTAYDEVIVTIMRQQGKTGLCYPKMVWRSTVVPSRLGSQNIVYTAQTRQKARERLEKEIVQSLRDAEQVSARNFREVPHAKARPGRSTREWRASWNNGSEEVQFGRGNFLKIDAPTRTSGHGPPLDDGNIDEAWAHRDDTIEQAMRPAQATRDDAQLWVYSAAGDENSFYLWRKVLAGRKACESGAASRVAYFEWSLPDGVDIEDEDAWWEFMPALGRTVRPEFIRAELERARRDPEQGEDYWRRHYANQWPRIPVLGDGPREPVIDAATWAGRVVPAGTALVGDVAVGVFVSPEGRSAAITVAGRTAYGTPVVDVQCFDPGHFWLEARLAGVREAWSPKVIGYPPGATKSLAPEIGRAAGTVPVKELSSGEYASACEAFAFAFTDAAGDVRVAPPAAHMGQDWLTSSVEGAAKLMRGTGWLWDPVTSLADIAPLGSATVALRLLEMVPSTEASWLFT
jgi:hypothetical protein